MEKVLGQDDYQKLVKWSHPRDPKLQYSFTKFPGSNGDEDSVSVCPVIERNGKPHVVFATHLRPARLDSTKSKGLSLEIVAGYNKDKDAAGTTTDENAKKETSEETGLKIKKLHRIPDSNSGNGSSAAEYVADCESTKVIKPKEPDMTELALISVPLNEALAYIEQVNKTGIDVHDHLYKLVIKAQKIFKVKEKETSSTVKPNIEWTIANETPNELQKDGLKLLAEKKDFLPEAAQIIKKKRGFFGKIWDGFVYIVTFKWLFSRGKS